MKEPAKRAVRIYSVLLIVVLLSYWRWPELLLHPRFWYEEGISYFADIRGKTFVDALTYLNYGYYNFFANVAAYLAAWPAVEHAPVVTTYSSLAVQLIPYWVIQSSESTFWQGKDWKRHLGCAMLLLSPNSADVWLSSIVCQYHFCVVTLLILLEDPVTLSPARRVLSLIFLAVGGVSGLLSCVLMPLFAWRTWQERTRARLIQCLVLLACTAFHSTTFLTAAMSTVEGSARLQPFALDTFFHVFANRVVVTLILGRGVAEPLGNYLYALSGTSSPQAIVAALISGVVGIGVTWWLTRMMPREFRLPLAGSLFLLFTFSLIGSIDEKRWMIHSAFAQRYFFVPGLILCLMLLTAVERAQTARRWAMQLAIVLYLVNASLVFRSNLTQFQVGPRWKYEVRRWRHDPNYAPEVWPSWRENNRMKLDPRATD